MKVTIFASVLVLLNLTSGLFAADDVRASWHPDKDEIIFHSNIVATSKKLEENWGSIFEEIKNDKDKIRDIIRGASVYMSNMKRWTVESYDIGMSLEDKSAMGISEDKSLASIPDMLVNALIECLEKDALTVELSNNSSASFNAIFTPKWPERLYFSRDYHNDHFFSNFVTMTLKESD